ncbi:hypothetical protein ABM004_07100, partial [Pseudomonas aeruginosa]
PPRPFLGGSTGQLGPGPRGGRGGGGGGGGGGAGGGGGGAPRGGGGPPPPRNIRKSFPRPDAFNCKHPFETGQTLRRRPAR